MKHPTSLTLLAACAAAALSLPSRAAVTADEAKQLGSTLTACGAEKGANKDGSIPAYTGGLSGAMKAPRPGLPPALFTDEKPVLQLKADNAEANAARLSDGHLYLLKNYPGFRIDVYPTHRTFATPKFVADNCIFNASNAKISNEAVVGHKGAVPFPIPKTGLEAMFNNLWTWRGADRQINAETWFVSAAGKRSLATANIVTEAYPYYYEGTARQDGWEGKLRGAVIVEVTAPAYSAGEKTLILGPADPIGQETQGWTYFTGQRRLRKIPNVQYDVPFNITSGNTNFDDNYGFNGATDRYDWKLVGKKEMFVPYNNNNINLVDDLDKLMGPNFVNPDHVRFELHRVWVVDATLKAGARHTVPKRRFYIDEDSWNIVSTDQWDAKGQFWKNINILTWVYPEVPTMANFQHIVYNVQSKAYNVQNMMNRAPGGMNFKAQAADFYTTQSLERQGVR
ncbi:DUF1329 domain-containing protein [Aquabacterium sp.]|uniref:DUF1329 domain-containing protein n=1 Tax=Aquabacterium sp. TaxID=1872578 RepID=UPI002C22137A|nr:DUF1329 domain-containing protein [Aquabacterium sp.]HSW06747.1 DUF1329 domain-containing protein [Aquabacterium sp.]